MSNYPSMDYCKFENTLAHLKQIESDMLDPNRELSADEERARLKILQILDEWVNGYNVLDED